MDAISLLIFSIIVSLISLYFYVHEKRRIFKKLMNSKVALILGDGINKLPYKFVEFRFFDHTKIAKAKGKILFLTSVKTLEKSQKLFRLMKLEKVFLVSKEKELKERIEKLLGKKVKVISLNKLKQILEKDLSA